MKKKEVERVQNALPYIRGDAGTMLLLGLSTAHRECTSLAINNGNGMKEARKSTFVVVVVASPLAKNPERYEERSVLNVLAEALVLRAALNFFRFLGLGKS